MNERTASQLTVIRHYLLGGKTITPLEALDLCGCLRLSSVIYRLRHEEGLPIVMIQPEASEGKPYAKYFIDHKYFRDKRDRARQQTLDFND